MRLLWALSCAREDELEKDLRVMPEATDGYKLKKMPSGPSIMLQKMATAKTLHRAPSLESMHHMQPDNGLD